MFKIPNMDTTSVFSRTLLAYQAGATLIVHQGGTSCFAGVQKVITRRGLVPISEILPGDIVKCFNESTNTVEWKPVKQSFKYDNSKKTVRVRLKSGKEIIATEDHKVFYEGGWHSLKHILSLSNGKMKDDTRV